MKSSVIIKGNRYGFQIFLNPDLPFEELLKEVAVKFRESTHFFDSRRSVAVSFEGRDLSSEEQNVLIETIRDNKGPTISYIIDGGRAVEADFARALRGVKSQPDAHGSSRTGQELEWEASSFYETAGQAADSKTEDESPVKAGEESGAEEWNDSREEGRDGIVTEAVPENLVKKDGQFYRGTLRSGQRIEVDGSLVVLGDINPGAQIIAGGNVVVLGCLKGTVYAGYPDNLKAFVAALHMEPMQIQIGTCIARSPDQKEKKARGLRSKKQKPMEAKLAFVEQGNIFIETITRSLINEISVSE